MAAKIEPRDHGMMPHRTTRGVTDERIHGDVAPGFEDVRVAFARNFARHREIGAALTVYHRGTQVVHLWGGYGGPAYVNGYYGYYPAYANGYYPYLGYTGVYNGSYTVVAPNGTPYVLGPPYRVK